MDSEQSIPSGIAILLCPTCKGETTIRWYGKLVIKRCWKCDAILEERPNAG